MKKKHGNCGNKYRLGKKHSKKTKEKMSGTALNQNRNGERNGNWNGGKKMLDGYLYIYLPNHPSCTKEKYVVEHRMVMEKHLGRYLTKKEVVHHINHNRLDNRISNLKLYKNNSEHCCKNHLKRDKKNRKVHKIIYVR